jgi:hypothetical protein
MTRLLVPAGSWFLACILAYSAVDKILHWSLFLKALTLYRVVPVILLPAVGYAVPALELLAALAILIPWFRARGLGLAAWLLASFTAMIGYAMIAAPGVLCGCLFSLGPTRATPAHFILNVMLTGLAWVLAGSSAGESVRSAPGEAV